MPCPPGFMLTCYENDEIFMQKYLKDSPGYYTSGDAGFYDEHGFLNIMSRIDDVITTSGIKISASKIEDAIYQESSIVDVAVVAKSDEDKG